MKILATEFKKDGYSFVQLKRVGRVALFQKSKLDHANKEHYEVFLVQSHTGMVIGGNVVPPAEFMPSTNSWGKLGWSFTTRAAGDSKFDELATAEAKSANEPQAAN